MQSNERGVKNEGYSQDRERERERLIRKAVEIDVRWMDEGTGTAGRMGTSEKKKRGAVKEPLFEVQDIKQKKETTEK